MTTHRNGPATSRESRSRDLAPGEHRHNLILRYGTRTAVPASGVPRDPAEPSVSFAAALRFHRLRVGLTQEQLARKTGLSARNIRKLEAGEITSPRPTTVALLANTFRLTATDRDQFHQTAAAARQRPGVSFGPPVPAQLPLAPPLFTGRRPHLERLDQLLVPAPTGRIAAIHGPAGVGKSALAIHWAHQVRDRFPDGQLYLNLRDPDPSGAPSAVAGATRALLEGLHVPPPQLPTSPAAQTGLFRSLLADRRMLVLLDNADDSTQVRPLLPGTGDCVALITSRNQLSSLTAAEGARQLYLDAMSATEARRMLQLRLTRERIATEPDAVHKIVDRCACLPISLAMVAAHAAANPRRSLHAIARELAGSESWLAQDGVADGTDRVRMLGSHAGG